MDINTINNIVGFLGNALSIIGGGRNVWAWLRKITKKNPPNFEMDSSGPEVQRVFDSLRSTCLLEYSDHYFSENDIQIITEAFLKKNNNVFLTPKDISDVKEKIKSFLQGYNKYLQNLMSPGEKIILDAIESKGITTEEKGNIVRFRRAIEKSTLELRYIDGLINGEYEIDRSTIIKKIHASPSRFISIIGCAGSGKSVIAKKLVEKEKNVLFIRADALSQKEKLSDVWDCDLTDAVTVIKDERLFIVLDALEFIADAKREKWLLVQELYEFVNKHGNVYIITTCRIEDQNALLLKLQGDYPIDIFEVPELTTEELANLSKRYASISQISEQQRYLDLLKTPFYINLIVSKIRNDFTMQDENTLRKEIWNRVICLADKAKDYNLSTNDIRQAVEAITFNRVKRFETGVDYTEIRKDIADALISEDVLVRKNDQIRLKYDIYEDICFENMFDKAFNSCKGVYKQFFEEISNFGKCIYRRYQIWISNKLFLKDNREKFLYALLKGDEIPEKWNEQTEIGIVKSRHCKSFFEEYFLDIIKANKLEEFLQIINLYAFEARFKSSEGNNYSFLQMSPIGIARNVLIIQIWKHWNEIHDNINKNLIISLCRDYTCQSQRDTNSSTAACEIIKSYVDEYLKRNPEKWTPRATQEVVPLLLTLYQLADVCKEWICNFWKQLIQYMENDKHRKNWAVEIAQETINNDCSPLICTLPEELCHLANALWINSDEEDDSFYSSSHGLFEPSMYGLSEKASDFYFNRRRVENNTFLLGLFSRKLEIGLPWAIEFINHAVDCYAKNNNDEFDTIEIWFCENGKKERYLSSMNLWLVGIEDHRILTIIGDIIYVLRSILIATLQNLIKNGETQKCILFAEYIKKELYRKSNNTALLTIIEAIGFNFKKELPGFAIDLATSMPLLYQDMQRYGLYVNNPAKQLLENQLLLSVGVPSFNTRYILDPNCNIDLQSYLLMQQVNAKRNNDEKILKKCYEVLDYLYSITKNEGEEAYQYLQIQKMDFRNAELKQIDEGKYVLEPNISGAAKEIVEQHNTRKKNSSARIIEQKLQSILKTTTEQQGQVNYQAINNALDIIIPEIKKDKTSSIFYENLEVQLISIALKNESLEQRRRELYCNIWIDGLNAFFKDGVFAAKTEYFPVLLQQLETNVDKSVKKRIKKLMLDSLLGSNQNGLIFELAKYVKNYLNEHKALARNFYNTIMHLAEDEMNHQVYNAKYIRFEKGATKFNFIPNEQPRLTNIDYRLKAKGGELFKSHKKEIIEKYLFREETTEIDITDINKYDIGLLCYASGCGLGFEDNLFKDTIRGLMIRMFELWHSHEYESSAYMIIDTHCVSEVVTLFQREINSMDKKACAAINLLYEDIPFELFTTDAIEFYHDIFDPLGAIYFDSFNLPGKRKKIEEILRLMGEKTKKIMPENVRIELYRPLIFAFTGHYHDNWEKLNTDYSYMDKMFLNKQFSQYGSYHIKDIVFTIYMFHMEKLLPEILLSLFKCFEAAKQDNANKFQSDIQEVMGYVDRIVLTAYMNCCEEIQKDEELTSAFDGILSFLVKMNNSKAAIILDEFRIH